jgi:hypothetical protein
VTPFELKDLLGYSSLAMVKRYAHLAPERLRTAAAALDAFSAGTQAGLKRSSPPTQESLRSYDEPPTMECAIPTANRRVKSLRSARPDWPR